MKRRSIIIAAITLLTLGLSIAAYSGSVDVTTTGVDITGPVVVDGDINDTNGNLLTVPPGAIFMFPIETPPAGYLECNGKERSRTTYAKLFAVLGTTYGAGNGSTTFNLPDMRGQFVRGWDNDSVTPVDPDRDSRLDRGDGTTGNQVGTKQVDAMQRITGKLGDNTGGAGSGLIGNTSILTGVFSGSTKAVVAGGGAYAIGRTLADFDNANSTSPNAAKTSDFETRPTNIYMMYCIKY